VLPEFLDAVQRLGFAVRRRDTSNSHFVLAEFQKRGAAPQAGAVRWPELKACQYKKR
jgi:ribosomal RNA-processing protein 8